MTATTDKKLPPWKRPKLVSVSADAAPVVVPGSMLDYALRYAALGWHVFPVWGCLNGKCRCGDEKCDRKGKHPHGRLAANGSAAATTDPARIGVWWTQDHDAGIAVLPSKSGLVVVDVDPRNGGDQTIDIIDGVHGTLASDVMQWTQSGGQHHFFLFDGSVSSLPGKLGPGVDLQHNTYVVVSPTQGEQSAYMWDEECNPLQGRPPSRLPDWIRDLASNRSKPLDIPAAAAGTRPPLDDRQMAELRAALAMIPADEREIWRNVGFGLHNDIGGKEAYLLWEEWSRRSAKFDPVDQAKNWRSFRRLGLEGIGLPTIFKYAYDHGLPKLGPAAPPPAGVTMVGNLTTDEAIALANPAPVTIIGERSVSACAIPATGLDELAAWANATSAQAHPLAGQAVAIAIASACSSRRYESQFGDPTHLYIGLLGANVTQVRYALAAAEAALLGAGLRAMLRAQRFTSPQQVYATIFRSPSALYCADDWGDQLRFAKRQPSGLLEQTLAVLSGRIYAGQTIALDNWAELGVKPMTGNEAQPTLYKPSISLLAAIGAQQLMTVFRRSELARGAIDAMLFVPMLGDGWTDRPSGLPPPIPTGPLERMRLLRGFEPGQTVAQISQILDGLALQEPTPQTVLFHADIGSLEQAWIQRAAGLRPSARPLAAGARRNLRRLATAIAAWANPRQPIVTHDILVWAQRFVSECFEVTAEECDLLATDDDERPDAYQMLLDVIVRQGPAGVARRDMHKLCRAYRSLSSSARGELLDQMLADQVLHQVATPSGRGIAFVAARFVQLGDRETNGRQEAYPIQSQENQHVNVVGDAGDAKISVL